MRLLKYKSEQFKLDDAYTICQQLEASLGINLMVKSPITPNDVHGFFNTDSDGNIEVHIYEDEDCKAIEAIPDTVTFTKCEKCGNERNDFTDKDKCCGIKLNHKDGRKQKLRHHKGIYKHANHIDDNQLSDCCENVLVGTHKMTKHSDMKQDKVCRYEHHSCDDAKKAKLRNV